MRKGIITGGCGFIGRRVIQLLKSELPDFNWLVLSNPDYCAELENSGRAELAEAGIAVTDCNLTNPIQLPNNFNKPDLILHLASNTDTRIKDHSINLLGAKNLFDALAHDLSGCRVVFTSSIAACDNKARNDVLADEFTDYNTPRHEYGRAKAATEEFIKKSDFIHKKSYVD